MKLQRAKLSYNEIKKKSKEFLSHYHPDNTIPVPIEKIIEFELKIDIVPVPGLHRTFEYEDIHSIDAYTEGDMNEIHVDDYVYRRVPNRYRFTLAHELAHIYLHKGIYKEYKFKTKMEWIEFHQSLALDEFGWFEWQADSFAGLILVPEKHLFNIAEKYLKRRLKKLESQQVPTKGIEDSIWDYIFEDIAEDFKVSTGVIRIRADKESLRDYFKFEDYKIK